MQAWSRRDFFKKLYKSYFFFTFFVHNLFGINKLNIQYIIAGLKLLLVITFY